MFQYTEVLIFNQIYKYIVWEILHEIICFHKEFKYQADRIFFYINCMEIKLNL